MSKQIYIYIVKVGLEKQRRDILYHAVNKKQVAFLFFSFLFLVPLIPPKTKEKKSNEVHQDDGVKETRNLL